MASESDDVKIYDSFDKIVGIPELVLRGIYAKGFDTPSAIQQRAIKPIIDGRDVLAQAQSGTGKTCAFTTGALSRVDISNMNVQVLMLSPTRELANQTQGVAEALGDYAKIKVIGCTGGNPVREDIAALQKGAHVVVGTPGRVFDMMDRNALRREHIKVLVMDEADQMLEGRFREQVECILNMGFPEATKVCLFSATMPDAVIEVANKILRDPVRILLPPEKVTLEGIKQWYVDVEQDTFKFDCLCDLYQQIMINQAIIYCNERKRVEWLAKRLQQENFDVGFIHGEMDPKDRKAVISDFRVGKMRVLVSSDLLARGIDVQQVSLVINYELPVQQENYIHRIGRSGRFGRKGTALNLVTAAERKDLAEIEKFYSTIINPLPGDLSGIF
jgi:translation initiation factor 4A